MHGVNPMAQWSIKTNISRYPAVKQNSRWRHEATCRKGHQGLHCHEDRRGHEGHEGQDWHERDDDEADENHESHEEHEGLHESHESHEGYEGHEDHEADEGNASPPRVGSEMEWGHGWGIPGVCGYGGLQPQLPMQASLGMARVPGQRFITHACSCMPTFRDILHFLYQVYDADEYIYIYIFQICDASPTYMRIIYVYIYIYSLEQLNWGGGWCTCRRRDGSVTRGRSSPTWLAGPWMDETRCTYTNVRSWHHAPTSAAGGWHCMHSGWNTTCCSKLLKITAVYIFSWFCWLYMQKFVVNKPARPEQLAIAKKTFGMSYIERCLRSLSWNSSCVLL